MRASLLVWCVVALAESCRSDAEPGPPRSDPPPPITATPERAAPLSATPQPTGATMTPATQCQKDSDCAVTRVPDGDCCPSLCTPRAVTAVEAQRLQEQVQRCEAENRQCRVP